MSTSHDPRDSGAAARPGQQILPIPAGELAEHEHMLLGLLYASTQHLTTESKLAAFAEAAVPAVSDVCVVYLLDDPLPAGQAPRAPIHTRRIAAPSVPGMIGPMPGRPAVWTGNDPASAAVAAAAVVIVHYIPDHPPDWAHDAGVAEAIRQGRVHCTAMVPVTVDDEVRAVIAFAAGPGRPAYTEKHRELFSLISAQAAIALRQGSRYNLLRDTALTLQRAMLTDPPPVEGLDIAVRYRPAGERIEVGGDWYDVFPLIGHRDDRVRLAVVVGDVAGHDISAATAMGQLRSMLRAHALHAEPGTDPPAPEQVLGALDRAIVHLGVVRLATGIVMHVESPNRATEPPGLRLTWSNAGHPAPILLAADRSIVHLGDVHGPALGVNPTVGRASATHHLIPGETLLLFSDGLFERRGRDYDACLDDLRATIAGAPAAHLEELCDALVRAAPDDDDVVLIALRQAPA